MISLASNSCPVHSLPIVSLIESSIVSAPYYTGLHVDFSRLSTIIRLGSNALQYRFDFRLDFVPIIVIKTLHFDAEVVFNFVHDHHVALPRDEGYGDTDATEATCSTDAVEVRLGICTMVGVRG